MKRQYLLVITGILIAGVLIGTGGATAIDNSDRTLIVTDAENGTELLTVPVDDGDQVTLEYTHSVERTPVRDIYIVDGPQLRLVRMEFHSYGAGLPAREAIDEIDGDAFVVEFDRPTDQLHVAPGRIANHTLRIDGHPYDLVAQSSGQSVTITVRDRGVIERIKHQLRI